MSLAAKGATDDDGLDRLVKTCREIPISPITIQLHWIRADARLNSAIRLVATRDAARTL